MTATKKIVRTLKLVMILQTFFYYSSCTAQKKMSLTKSPDTDKASKELVVNLMEEFMKLPSKPPGASVAVSSKNDIIFAEGFGYTNVETRKRVTPKTQFRAASVSKIITATILAKLIEDKKISLDDEIHKYLPSYPQSKYPITVRQLSGHIAGVPHYSKRDRYKHLNYNNVEDALNVFSHIPYLYKPGEGYEYSTHSYTLLSRVMEVAAGKSYLNMVSEYLCEPLSIYSTGPHVISNPTLEMTELYDFQENITGSIRVSNPQNPSYKWAGGGLISTPSDLVRIANGYINGFIEKEVVDKMFETQVLNSGKETGVGVGWRQNWDMNDRKIYEHAGIMEGTRTVISLFPEEQLSISVMFNAKTIRRIEETAHILALPFLSPPLPIVQPKGYAELTIKENMNKKKPIREGFIILDGKNDRLVLDSGSPKEVTYKLIYMQRSNIYALIHPHGILYTEILMEDSVISGNTMYYHSPGLTKPSLAKPLFEFKGNFKVKK